MNEFRYSIEVSDGRGSYPSLAPGALMVELPARERLVEIVNLLSKVDLVAVEVAGEAAARETAQYVTGLVEEVTAGLSRILDFFDQHGDESPQVGLTFVARMAIGEKRTALRSAVERDDFWMTMEALGGAQREVVRSVDRLVAEIARERGLPYERLHILDELEIGLETRLVYARFRQTLRDDPGPAPEALAKRLRSTANAIAVLTGRPIYPHTRVCDRSALRSVQGRISATLRSFDSSEAWASDARRLWQDIVNLGHFFREINRRPELIEHDAKLVEELFSAVCNRLVTIDELRRRAVPLIGRCDELDTLIEAPGCTYEDWLTVLHVSRSRVATAGAGAGEGFA